MKCIRFVVDHEIESIKQNVLFFSLSRLLSPG